MRKPIIYYLRQRGSVEHPRYLISDQHVNCFDGEKFGSEANGLLYASFSEAAFTSQHLLVQAFGGRKHVTRFVAPIQIVVHSDKPPNLNEVQAWALKVARLILGTPQHGNGPVEDSLGLVQINWNEMEQLD